MTDVSDFGGISLCRTESLIESEIPYAEYKDSGVPWLGKVPAHWEVLNLKRVVKFNPSKSEIQKNLGDNEEEERVVFLPMSPQKPQGKPDKT